MAIDIVKALGSSVGGGKKKNKIKPRLIHVKGGKDSVIEKEVIYE